MVRTIEAGAVRDTVARLCIEATHNLPADVELALAAARTRERSPLGVIVLDQILENAEVARTELRPGELDRIRTALADLKQVMSLTDREVIHQQTHALNHATQHLAEVMMNRSVREALAGKNVTDV